MLIVGKFKDYYDKAGIYGVDKKVVYNRQTRIVENTSGHYSEHREIRGTNYKHWTEFWIGFCGKWYFGRADDEYPYYLFNKIGGGKIKKELVTYGKEAIDLSYPEGQNKWYWRNYNQYYLQKHGAEYRNPFLELDSPVLAVVGSQLIVNPCLADVHFQKVKSPFEAWQEIEMFMTNDLAKQVDPAPLSDKLRAAAHGFDKHSFRKDTPPKRKQK